MKKVIVSVCFVALMVVAAFAQEQAPKPTLAELQWRAKAIEQEFQYLAERQKVLRIEYQQVQAQIKAMQKEQKPKAEAPKVETPVAE